MKKRIGEYLLVGLLALCCGCASFPEGDAWPLLLHQGPDEQGCEEFDVCGPIFSYRCTPQETTHSLRPFFMHRYVPDKDLTEMLVAWPFILYRNAPQLTQIQLLPFYFFRDKHYPERGQRDFDWFFLPFLTFGGSDTREGDYLWLFTYGNLKGLLGYDEIVGKPFPLYVTAKDGAYHTWAYFWPFFRFGEGGGRRFSFYCFFYVNYEYEGKFRRRSYLWPLIHIQENDLHKKHPTKTVSVFPFYGVTTSDVATTRAILWPLFTYAENKETGYREYNVPFPLIKWKKGGRQLKQDELRIFPFYWHLHQPQRRETRFLWPLGWDISEDNITYRKESFYALPFYWQHWRQDKKTGRSTKEVNVWPLYSYSRDADGHVRQAVLSPLWFKDFAPYGFDNLIVPLFTFFERCQGPRNRKSVTFLGPLYNSQQDGDKIYYRILFCTYQQQPAKQRQRFSVLWGLVDYQNDAGAKSLGLFFLPRWIKWGGQHKP